MHEQADTRLRSVENRFLKTVGDSFACSEKRENSLRRISMRKMTTRLPLRLYHHMRYSLRSLKPVIIRDNDMIYEPKHFDEKPIGSRELDAVSAGC